MVEMAKAQKECGKGRSGLNRRDLNDSDIASIYIKAERKNTVSRLFTVSLLFILNIGNDVA